MTKDPYITFLIRKEHLSCTCSRCISTNYTNQFTQPELKYDHRNRGFRMLSIARVYSLFNVL